MAHAIFNVSPVKFLSSIQDHVFTVTPTFKNKSYANKSDKTKAFQQQDEQQRNSSASPVTLQLTLATDSASMMEAEQSQQQQQQMTEIAHPPPFISSPTSVPIDIPRSYPLNVPVNSHQSRGDYEGLMMSNNYLSTSYTSHHSFNYQQENNLLSLANSISQSPYFPAEDLTVCFDGLAVRSPTGSFYTNGGVYSPQQINSPINIGSPNHAYGASPDMYSFNNGGYSPQSPTNYNFLAGSPSYVGSPNSPPHFLGSPAMAPTFNDLGIDTTTPSQQQQQELSSSFGFTYLSPTLQPQSQQPQQQQQQQQLSPLHSPSPTGSYVNQNLFLFPPNGTSTGYSRPTSPVPDDVILTASEVNEYINSPYLSATIPSPSDVTLSLSTSYDDGRNQISELLFGQHSNTNSPLTPDDMELFPNNSTNLVTPQPQFNAAVAGFFFSEDDLEEEEDEDEDIVDSKTKRKQTKITTPSGRRAKIHKCPYCDHTSNRANNMREHTQIHNPNRPKPHACKICNRAFARKHDMNRHYISCKKQQTKNSAGGSNRYVMTSPSLDPTT